VPETTIDANSEGAQGRARLARPARHARAGSLGLSRPRRSAAAAYVKPYLGETMFGLLLFSYLRTDPAAFGRHLKTPGLTIVAALWVMVAVPLFALELFVLIIVLSCALIGLSVLVY
jgi:hypothetical protein